MKSDQCRESDPTGLQDSDKREASRPDSEEDLAKHASPRSTRAIEERQRDWPAPRPKSPLEDVHRRAGHTVPPAYVETFPKCYRLSIALPRPGGTQFSSDMITVSARRGGRLAIVADAWHLERDC